MPAEAAAIAVAAPAPVCGRARLRAPHRLYYAVLALALAAAIVPFWLVRFPAMMDYGAHLARCYILAHFHAGPNWQRYYRVEFGPIPNLAMDVIVVPLGRWLPIIVSGKIFLSLTALLYVTGCDALGRAAWGHRHWMALVAGFTFFNSDLLNGRVNYIFGLALFFWVLALWLRIRQRMTTARFLVFCALSAVVYLAHLGAVAVLGLVCATVALLDFARHRRPARLVAEVGWLASPTALLLLGFLRRNGSVGQLDWGSWLAKAANAFTLVQTYNLRPDAAAFGGCAVCAGVLLWHARWQRQLAVAGLVLLGCSVAVPMHIFTADYADARLVAPGFVLLMIALHPRPGRMRAVALGAVMALFLGRVGYIARQWIAADADARQALAIGGTLAPGDRVDVLSVLEGKSAADLFNRRALNFTIDYWSVSRGAYMSNLFAQAGQQPLIQRAELRTCTPGEGKGCLAHFDYVWTDTPSPPLQARLQAAAAPVARWRSFTLWRVRRFR